MKKILTLILSMALLVTSLPMPITFGVDALNVSPNKYNGGSYFTGSDADWKAYKASYQIPMETPKRSKNGLYFNKELYEDLKISVYGSHKDVPNNDFKKGNREADEVGNVISESLDSGYYQNSTGEFRYHGYDAQGNRYPNMRFRLDQQNSSKLEDRTWMYRVWERRSPYHMGMGINVGKPRIDEVSEYNKAAIEAKTYSGEKQQEAKNVQRWISDLLPFEIKYSSDSSKNAWDYAHVLSRPTTLVSGEAAFYYDKTPNQKTGGNKVLWYHVNNFEKQRNKELLPLKPYPRVKRTGDALSPDKKIDLTYDLKVTGVYRDGELFDNIDGPIPDEVLRTIKYNREDIKEWRFEVKDSFTEKTHKLVGESIAPNQGSVLFKIKIPYTAYNEYIGADNTVNPVFTGFVELEFHDGKILRVPFDTLAKEEMPPMPEVEPIDPASPLKVKIEAPNEMLDTETFKLYDKTPMEEGFTRAVYLQGEKLSESAAEKFISGQYLFPLLARDCVYTYQIVYNTGGKNPIEFVYNNYVLVYNTKPHAYVDAEGTFKENRTIKFWDRTHEATNPYVLERVSFDTVSFETLNRIGSQENVKFGTKTDKVHEFIVKEETEIHSRLVIKTNVRPEFLQRNDIPSNYHIEEDVYKIYVLPDIAPDVVANIWNVVLPRNESLDLTYEPSSVDKDVIKVNRYKIYYDANGDMNPETIVAEGDYKDFKGYTPSKLGEYKMVFYVEEAFGQPTLSQFITEADKKVKQVERPFSVDNLAPMTRLYTDIEIEFPKADIMMLNDEAIERTNNEDIKKTRVDWMNQFRQSGIHGNVYVWDLHTYVHEKETPDTWLTGESYPPESKEYLSEGWSGKLTRFKVENNPYPFDDGYMEEFLKTIYQEFNTTWTNVVTNYRNGEYSESAPAPSSIPISGDGFSGTMSMGSPSMIGLERYDKGNIESVQTWEVTYSGTGSKQVEDEKWIPNWIQRDSYTGYYKGMVYKYVKQPFGGTFRMDSDKYLVYFAKDKINNRADIDAVMAKGKSKVILVGDESLKSQYPNHFKWIDGKKKLEDIYTDIVDIVAEENAFLNQQLLLINETFTLNHTDFDDEKDPITPYGFMYVHDSSYYDNPLGDEPGTFKTFDTGTYGNEVKSKFSKPGKYTIYRQIEDEPVDQKEYKKISNLEKMFIYVHRKPIAKCTLDWDYDSVSKTYKTTWVDLSYDLDHQITDAQKGIRDRRIRYRKSGTSDWIYSIPDNLSDGSYELKYIVKDIEGVWSDEFSLSFTLKPAPPVQFKGEMRTEDDKFTLKSIPASEKIEFFNVWTRYPYDLRIEAVLPGKGSLKTVNFSNLDSKVNQDINWRNFPYTVPETVPDGFYSMQLSAVDVANPSHKAVLNFPFTVFTPIDLQTDFAELVGGEPTVIEATTSIYASQVSVEILRGTSHEVTLQMKEVKNDGTRKTWKVTHTLRTKLPEGDYQARFTARTPSGKTETLDKSFKLVWLYIASVDVRGDWNLWNGSRNQVTGKLRENNPMRFLSHEKIWISSVVKGKPDKVEVRFSPELENYVYRTSSGITHYHNRDFGLPEIAFPLNMPKKGTSVENFEVSYILPLAPDTKGPTDTDNMQLRPQYWVEVIAQKGSYITRQKVYIDLTGNVHFHVYMQKEK